MRLLILGSGPNVVQCKDWPKTAFDHILAINNAWTVRPDWDELIHPEDFPEDRRPSALAPGQKITTAQEYVPAQNAYGGFVYAGGTMAFTAGYWALATYRPKVIAYLGCDMVYPKTANTHFYGKGSPDPLRDDVTLQSLEGKSARLMVMGALQGCAFVNLSQDESRLVFPRARWDRLSITPLDWQERALVRVQSREAALDYWVPSGRYWEEADRFDATALREIDNMWLEAAGFPGG